VKREQETILDFFCFVDTFRTWCRVWDRAQKAASTFGEGSNVILFQSMHWSTPKTKDRMLETGGSSGPSSLGAGGVTAAQRRASEGGANLHWAGRGTGSAWGTEAPSEVVSKFRNYEI
jgi:hypothetical protein